MRNVPEEFNNITDEQIESWVGKNLSGQGAPLALSIIMRRSVNETRNSVNELKEAIKDYSYSSERYSKKIVWLTWALVLLTIVILIFTAVMVFKM
jgi:hypothetical protein